MVFPWQSEQWQQLKKAKNKNRLPHALLFTGMKGVGKTSFAIDFSHFLFCQSKPENADYCGDCHACRLVATRAHPNVLWIEPEKAGQAIKVDQIRSVSEFTQHSSLQGEYRLVIVNPANQMNANAANALLKTLEEPASDALLILISDASMRLPATILSRCQRWFFPRPKTEVALSWLQTQLSAEQTADFSPAFLLDLAKGAPLAARDLLQDEILGARQHLFHALDVLSRQPDDILSLAATLQEYEPLLLLDFSLSWILDLLRLQLSDDSRFLTNQDKQPQFLLLKNRTQVKNTSRYMAYLQNQRAEISRGINLNKQLVIENILIRWVECMRCS